MTLPNEKTKEKIGADDKKEIEDKIIEVFAWMDENLDASVRTHFMKKQNFIEEIEILITAKM